MVRAGCDIERRDIDTGGCQCQPGLDPVAERAGELLRGLLTLRAELGDQPVQLPD